MSTGFYLLDHPPVRSQYRRPRRGTFTGAIGIHTTEGVMDTVGADTGAENVASYITRRSDPGSYHHIFDSDSHVPMLPDNSEAYAIAADGLNRSTVNMAFACRTTDLHPESEWTRAAFRFAAAEIVACWGRNRMDPWGSLRWLTREQVLAGWSGLFHHGTVQPWDRHDAFVKSPHRVALEGLLLAEIRQLLVPVPDPDEDDPMAVDWLYYHEEGSGTEWVVTPDGHARFYGPAMLSELRAVGRIPKQPKRMPKGSAEHARAGNK